VHSFSSKCILAIDTHDIMYYGDPDIDRRHCWYTTKESFSLGIQVRKHKRPDGWGGERLTLAAVPVLHEPRVEHVRMLIEHAFTLGIKPKLILLDGAYNSAEIINCLNERRRCEVHHLIRIAIPIEGIRQGRGRFRLQDKGAPEGERG
jgi:hypothetical protein